jgi:hypothetical protein
MRVIDHDVTHQETKKEKRKKTKRDEAKQTTPQSQKEVITKVEWHHTIIPNIKDQHTVLYQYHTRFDFILVLLLYTLL